MSVAYQSVQKTRYRITLDIEVMEDFDPHQIHWEDLFELEGSERVIDSYVEDLSTPTSGGDLAVYVILKNTGVDVQLVSVI